MLFIGPTLEIMCRLKEGVGQSFQSDLLETFLVSRDSMRTVKTRLQLLYAEFK